MNLRLRIFAIFKFITSLKRVIFLLLFIYWLYVLTTDIRCFFFSFVFEYCFTFVDVADCNSFIRIIIQFTDLLLFFFFFCSRHKCTFYHFCHVSNEEFSRMPVVNTVNNRSYRKKRVKKAAKTAIDLIVTYYKRLCVDTIK